MKSIEKLFEIKLEIIKKKILTLPGKTQNLKF